MEEKKEESEAEINEHGPEHWFSKWERQCLAEAEREEPNEEAVDQNQEKLWHLFQNSATAVAQLYKGLWGQGQRKVIYGEKCLDKYLRWNRKVILADFCLF